MQFSSKLESISRRGGHIQKSQPNGWMRHVGTGDRQRIALLRVANVESSVAGKVPRNSVKRKKANAKKVTAGSLEVLVKDQEYRCALSGIKLTPDNAALDHIVPLSEGGQHTISNCQWLLPEINAMKGTMEQGAFVRLCKTIAAWNE